MGDSGKVNDDSEVISGKTYLGGLMIDVLVLYGSLYCPNTAIGEPHVGDIRLLHGSCRCRGWTRRGELESFRRGTGGQLRQQNGLASINSAASYSTLS